MVERGDGARLGGERHRRHAAGSRATRFRRWRRWPRCGGSPGRPGAAAREPGEAPADPGETTGGAGGAGGEAGELTGDAGEPAGDGGEAAHTGGDGPHNEASADDDVPASTAVPWSQQPVLELGRGQPVRDARVPARGRLVTGERLTYRFGPLERRGILGQLRAGQAAAVAAGGARGDRRARPSADGRPARSSACCWSAARCSSRSRRSAVAPPRSGLRSRCRSCLRRDPGTAALPLARSGRRDAGGRAHRARWRRLLSHPLPGSSGRASGAYGSSTSPTAIARSASCPSSAAAG